MASQAAAAQPSSGLQLQLQHLPPYSRTTRRINHLPPLRTQHQRDREQNQQIGTLRLLLTIPYFTEHHERTRIDRDDDGHDENVDDDEEDYVFVERESEDDKMVQLTEVPDEHFEANQPGPIEDEGDFTDTDSEISTDSEYDPTDETLAERLAALKDIVPPTARGWVAAKASSAAGFGASGLWFAGKALWFVTSTALLIGVPFAICTSEEQQVVAMEQEYKMREMGSEALTEGGGAGQGTAEKVGAALGAEGQKQAL